ncbi:MAG TPA: TetR/AcrR family transcriptional regulator [Solirubrobacteraceae bacterium]|jgi:TetR/AcrR family transcriptional regulator, cholesterol catabolism regulator|nr:TetR/AcrR family transcriptional regulator [Solirubrobacteraceae bacterium]
MPAPPSPARPALRERYERRQDELVRLAAREFARRGYDQTTMQDLAASMGLATGALYHYFGSKEELLAAICDQLMEPLLASARELMAAGGDGDRRLRDLVRLWVAHVVAHRDHMLVFQQERHVIESGERWRAARAARKAFERIVAEALDGAHPRLQPPLPLLALLGMVNHTAQWYRPRGALSPEQIADGYVALLLGAR